MSSITIRKPEFRLLLGYPDVILHHEDSAEPVGSATPGTERFGADLRRLAAEVIRAGGRLTVVLPASEVWRGQVEPGGRAPRAEWRAARTRAAATLGVAPDALRTVVGPRAPGGLVPAAAVRRSTLSEVRTLLASVGLRPAAIVGAGSFDGFATTPHLGGRWAPPPIGRRRAFAGAAGLAAAAVALMVIGLRPDTPASVVPAAAPAVVAVAAPALPAPAPQQAAAVAAPVAAPHAAPVRVARADPPQHRPATPVLPAAIGGAGPVATLGTRSVSMVIAENKGRPVAEIRLAELTDPRGPLTDVAVPLHRPTKAAPATAGALGPVPSLRPEPRPATHNAAAAAPAPARAAAVTGDRPMPRPGEAKPVRVASLGNQVSDAVIAAAVLTPLARPEPDPTPAPKPVAEKPRVAPPAPKVAATPKPAAPRPVAAAPRVVAPAPKAVAAAAPKPVPVPQPVAVPQRVVRVEERRPAPTAQPVRVVTAPTQKPKPAAAQVRVTAAPAEPAATPRRASAAGFLGFGGRGARKDLALVGIFGGSNGRSALIQMPNGKIQKVSAGDQVQGMQVAAIGSDSVRVTDGRRETVLEMPE